MAPFKRYRWILGALIIGALLVFFSVRAFKGTKTRVGNLLGVNFDLRNADLRGAMLRGRNLRYANLDGAMLREAELSAADLTGAKLVSADLTKARLAYTDLSGADLQRANFKDTLFEATQLRGANFTGAIDLTQSQLDVSFFDEQIVIPDYLVSKRPLTFVEKSLLHLPFGLHKVALSEDATVVAAVGETDVVSLWRLNSENNYEEMTPLSGQSGRGRSVIFSPADRNIIASGSEDGAIRLWRLGESQPFKTLVSEPNEGYVFNLKYDVTGSRLYSSSRSATDVKTVHTWVLDSGNSTRVTKMKPSERIIDVCPNQDLIAVIGGSPPAVELRSIPDNSVRVLRGDNLKGITDGAFNDEGRMFAVSTYDGLNSTIMLWSTLDTNWIGQPLASSGGPVTSIAFSPDGQLLAAGWSSGSISVWRVIDGYQYTALRVQQGEVLNLAFSANGHALASASTDNTIAVWQIERVTRRTE